MWLVILSLIIIIIIKFAWINTLVFSYIYIYIYKFAWFCFCYYSTRFLKHIFHILWHGNHGPHLDIKEITTYGKFLENHEDFIGKMPGMKKDSPRTLWEKTINMHWEKNERVGDVNGFVLEDICKLPPMGPSLQGRPSPIRVYGRLPERPKVMWMVRLSPEPELRRRSLRGNNIKMVLN